MNTVSPLFQKYFLLFFGVDTEAMFPFSTLRIAFFLLFLSGIFAVFFSWALRRRTIILPAPRFLMFFLLSLFLSTLFSRAPMQSFFGLFESFSGGLFFLLLVVLFLFLVQIFQNTKVILLFFAFTIFIALFSSGYAFWQLITDNPEMVRRIHEQVFRVSGAFGHPNFFGQFLLLPLSITLIVLFRAKEVSIFLGKKYSPIFLFWAGICTTTPLLVALFLTRNRASILALILGILFLSFSSSSQRRKGVVFFLIATAGIALFLFSDLDLRSFSTRLLLWKSTFAALEFPTIFFGTGLASFADVVVTTLPADVFQYEPFYKIPANPHNQLLRVLVEEGLLGLSLLFSFFFFLAKSFWQKTYTTIPAHIAFLGIAMSLITLQFSFFVLENWVAFVFFLAIFFSPFSRSSVFLTGFLRRTLLVLCPFLFLFSGILAFSFWSADAHMREGIVALFSDRQKAIRHFERAEKIAPIFAKPSQIMLQFSTLFSRENEELFFPIAQSSLENMRRITSASFRFEREAIRLSGIFRDEKMWDAHFSAAQKKAPHLPMVYTAASNAAFAMGNCVKTISAAEQLRALTPPIFSQSKKTKAEKEQWRLFQKHAGPLATVLKNEAICRKKISLLQEI